VEITQKRPVNEDNWYIRDLVTCHYDERQLKTVCRIPQLMAHLSALKSPRKPQASRSNSRLGGSSSDVNPLLATFSLAVQIYTVLGSWSSIFFGNALLTEEPSVFDFHSIALGVGHLLEALPADATFAEERNVAKLLLTFMETHEQDPGGVLIGRRASLTAAPIKWTEQLSVYCTQLAYPIKWPKMAATANVKPNSLSAPSQLGGGIPRSTSGEELSAIANSSALLRSPASSRKALGPETTPVSSNNSVPRFSLRKGFSSKKTRNAAAEPEILPPTLVLEPPKHPSDLTPLILEWSEKDDDIEVATLVREFAANVRCTEALASMKTGDVVLVCFRCVGEMPSATPVVRFARLVGFVDNKHVAVYLDGREELTQWCVPTVLVRALPPQFQRVLERSLAALASSDAHQTLDTSQAEWRGTLASLVHPSQTSEMVDFGPVIADCLAELMASIASSVGINAQELSKKDKSALLLSDLHDLRVAVRLVNERKFSLEGLKAAVDIFVDKFLESIDSRNLFLPERRRIIMALHAGQLTARQLFEAAIGKVLSGLDGSLRALQPQMDAIESGDRKRELVNWWLTLIRTRVMQELYQRGYKENVTPEDYITEPPLDFLGVQSNLQLLRQCLDEVSKARTEDASLSTSLSTSSASVAGGLIRAIYELKTEIYSKIDQYMADCFAILCDLLRVQSCDLETAQQLFEKRKPQFLDRERKLLAQLLDDISYLQEMQELEKNAQGKSMHIVPVSGLAIGRMARLEQEMRTVCEVWGDRARSFSARKKMSRTFTSDSVSEEDDLSDVVVLQEDLDMHELRSLCHKLIPVVPVSDREFKMVKYKSCFLGCECVDALVRQGVQNRSTAVSKCADLFSCGYIEAVVRGMPFLDGFEFYRWSAGGARNSITVKKRTT
jgi:hypothetical protein